MARRVRGMSQAEAARVANVNLRTWQRWEAGETFPEDRFTSILDVFPEVADHVRSELLPPALASQTDTGEAANG